MNQYRLSNNSRVNQSGTVAQPQKLTFLQKLYKSIMKALAFINLRGRQLLWIGSTGFIIVMWPLIYLSVLQNSNKALEMA